METGDTEGNHGALILNTVDFEAGGFTVGEQQSFIHIFQTVSIGFRLGEERDFFRWNPDTVVHYGKVDHIVHPVDGEEQFAFSGFFGKDTVDDGIFYQRLQIRLGT